MHKMSMVIGIRPDAIRTSEIIKKLKARRDVDLQVIWTGQHYDEKLMGIFFSELGIPKPDVVLNCVGETHSQQHAKLISELEAPLASFKPDVCIFLGDANAVMGCIVPLKMGIPIAHIEAGSRSFDWSMPEERNRVIIDRVADVLYCYHHNYKANLIREGVNPDKIVVCGNTIVDVIEAHMDSIDNRAQEVMSRFNVKRHEYGVMTLHREAHMLNETLANQVLYGVSKFASEEGIKIIWPMMPRARKIKWTHLDDKFIVTEPLGMFDFIALEKNAMIEFTDSGTNQETSSILGTPCVVTRSSTERPETFDSNISVMAIQADDICLGAYDVLANKKNPTFTLGDGRSADIIVNDLVHRCKRMLWGIMDREDSFVRSHFA